MKSKKIFKMLLLSFIVTLAHFMLFFELKKEYPTLTLINALCAVIGSYSFAQTFEVYTFVKKIEKKEERLKRIIDIFS